MRTIIVKYAQINPTYANRKALMKYEPNRVTRRRYRWDTVKISDVWEQRQKHLDIQVNTAIRFNQLRFIKLNEFNYDYY